MVGFEISFLEPGEKNGIVQIFFYINSCPMEKGSEFSISFLEPGEILKKMAMFK